MNSDVLVSDSSVLDDLITKQGKQDIDMTDFEPETVILFLTLLESKAIDSIDDLHFLDLLRLSVQFLVQWLTKECHKHFATKIRNQEQRCLNGEWEYKEMETIWEECKFMVTKWGDPYMVFVDLFVKTAKELNGSGHLKFVEEFVKRDLTPLEINVILRSAAISTLGFLMKALLVDVEGNEQLTEKSRILLENLNMTLCKILCRADYNKMVDVLASRFLSMPPEDMKLIFDVVRDSSSLAIPKDISQENEVFDYKWMTNRFFPESGPVSITQAAGDAEIKSVNTLVDYILHMLLGFEGDIQQLDGIEDICKELEEICCKKNLNRAHRPYIRSSINLLKNINVDMGDGLLESYIRLLNLIEYSEILSSEYDNVEVGCSGESRGVSHFLFAHPGVNKESCAWKGTNCGFLLKKVESKVESEIESEVESKVKSDIEANVESEIVPDAEDKPVDIEEKVEVTMKFIRSDAYTCNQEEEVVLVEVPAVEEETADNDILRKMSETVVSWKVALGGKPNKSSTDNLLCIEAAEPTVCEPEPLLVLHTHDLISAADMSLLYTKLEVEKLDVPGEGFTAMVPVTLGEVITSLLNRGENYKVSELSSTESSTWFNQFVVYNIANCLVKTQYDTMAAHVQAEEVEVAAKNIVCNIVRRASQAVALQDIDEVHQEPEAVTPAQEPRETV